MGPNNLREGKTDLPEQLYTVSAMDYVFDYSLRMSLCFVLTQQVEPNSKLILNVVEFEPMASQWDKKE